MSFGGTVKLTGESEYRAALKDIAGNLRVLSSEMRVVTSQYDRNDTSVENLSAQNDILNRKISEQERKVAILREALEASRRETGDNSETTRKWQTELNNATAELNGLQRQVRANTEAMDRAESETDGLSDETKEVATNSALAVLALKLFGKEMEDVGDKTEETGEEEEETAEKTLELGDIIKANLISDAIVGGLKALANGVKAVGSAMGEALTAGAEYADTILTLSAQTGLSTDTLEKYTAVAELADVSTETFTGSMAKNIKAMSEAQKGSAKYAEVYDKLGVKVTDANGKLRDGEAVYWEAVDALGKISNETERDALAMEIFGKKAQDLNTIIDMGSKGFKELEKQAVDMGAVLGGEGLKALGAFDDQMQIFHSTTGATGNILASAFAPALTGAMEGVNGLMGSFNGLIAAVIGGDQKSIDQAFYMVSEALTDLIVGIEEALPQMMEVAKNLVKVLIDVIAEYLPWIVEEGIAMLSSLVEGIMKTIPQLLTTLMQIIQTILNTFIQNLPKIIEMGMQMLISLIQGIVKMLPELIPTIIDAVILCAETLLDNLDLIIDAGIELIFALVDGILDALPRLIDKMPVIINKVVQALSNNLPKLVQAGITLIVELAKGLIKAIPQLVKQIPQIITSIVSGLKEGLGKLSEVGLDLVKGLWNGIKDATGWIMDKIKGFGKSVLNGIKDFFGIKSPSRLFKDEVGKNLALGVGEGFADTMSAVSNDMASAIPTEFDANISTNYNAVAGHTQMSTFDMMVSAFKKALKEVKVVLDDREMGEFVSYTVERAVYA